MIKVLIVDDEVLVRVGLKMTIDWADKGFELLEEAENGRMALEIIEKNKPDIILTDIKMPEIDGIELLRKVKEEHPEIYFIVLSGYNDFELVKEAMKLGAVDYLLKLSLKPQELVTVLENVRRKIMEEQSTANENTLLKVRVNSNIADIKEKYFNKVFKGDYNSVNELKFQIGDQLSIQDSPLIVIIARMDFKSKLTLLNRFLDEELFDFSLKNVLQEVLDNYGPHEVLSFQRKEYLIIINTAEYSIDAVKRMCMNINDTINLLFSAQLYFGISSRVSGCDELAMGFQQAMQALRGRFYNQDAKVFFCTAEGQKDIQWKNKDINEEFGHVLKVFNSMREDWILKELQAFLGSVESLACLPENEAREMATEVLFAASKALRSADSTWKDVSEKYNRIYETIKEIDTMRDLKDYLTTAISDMFKFINTLDYSCFRQEVKKIVKYIDLHYMEDITLGMMAKHVNINEAYLSSMFKKETGKTMVEYLTDVRIQRAKDYLEKGELKIYEISEKVGYKDEHYFSKVFSKKTEMSPIDYRRLYSKKSAPL